MGENGDIVESVRLVKIRKEEVMEYLSRAERRDKELITALITMLEIQNQSNDKIIQILRKLMRQ